MRMRNQAETTRHPLRDEIHPRAPLTDFLIIIFFVVRALLAAGKHNKRAAAAVVIQP
jgi:hypothetical protein